MKEEQRKRMGQQLIDAGLINFDQLNTAVEYQKSLGGTIGQIVVKLGFVSDSRLTDFLSKKYHLPIVDLKTLVMPIDLVNSIPWELIEKHHVLPIHQSGNTMTIATADPTDYGVIEEIQYAVGKQVELNLAAREDIMRTIKELETQSQNRKNTKTPQTTHIRKFRPSSSQTTSKLSENNLLEDLRQRSGEHVGQAQLSKGELREALIPALIKKGVISRQDLYDAVLELLVRKGVIDKREMTEILNQDRA